MAYYMYLDGMLFPVTPSKIDMKIKGQNKTMNLINDGQINILKNPALTEVSFKALLPVTKYPFADYGGENRGIFVEPKYYLTKLEQLQMSKRPFQFIVTRNSPTGKSFFHTNLRVSLESYDISEDAKQGFDITVSIKLKQYKEYGTKVVAVTQNQVLPQSSRSDGENKPKTGTTYVVKEGDCLWNIAKQFYGNGASYTDIYNANKDVVGADPNLIYAGQVLTIPGASGSAAPPVARTVTSTPSGSKVAQNNTVSGATAVTTPSQTSSAPTSSKSSTTSTTDSKSNSSGTYKFTVNIKGQSDRRGEVYVRRIQNGDVFAGPIEKNMTYEADVGTTVIIEPSRNIFGINRPWGITVNGKIQTETSVTINEASTVTIDWDYGLN